MSRLRHKERAKGGKVHWNAGEEEPAAKEAEEKKHGGKVKVHGEGEKSKPRHDRAARARGGSVPGRARGGGVGADMKPLTTAAKVRHVTKNEQPEDGTPSD